MAEKDMYAQMGVASDKRSVSKAFKSSNKNFFPGAFCIIGYDPVLKVYEIMHTDGSGSKSIVRALCFLETGDINFLIHDLFDAVSMNTGDMATCGFFNIFKVINIKAVNGINVDKGAFVQSIAEAERLLEKLYTDYGIVYQIKGGETADLVDQTGSYILDVAMYSYIKEHDRVIKGNVKPGDGIWGFFSNGQAVWEDAPNSGIMSNGHTMARVKLLHPDYSIKYPFLAITNFFEGRFYLDEKVPHTKMTIAEALLSPTRQWAILIKMLIEELEATGNLHLLHGISMNTGGGATKVRNVGQKICYRKRMPKPPPIFLLIQDESGELWENMYTSFNNGIGLDIVGDTKGGILDKAIRAVSKKSKVRSLLLGDCTRSKSEENFVKLETPYGNFNYR